MLSRRSAAEIVAYGYHPALVSWMACSLNKLTISVWADVVLSQLLSTNPGVPQFFILLPIFFLFVNDLTCQPSILFIVLPAIPLSIALFLTLPVAKLPQTPIRIPWSSVHYLIPIFDQSLHFALPTICFNTSKTSLLSVSLRYFRYFPQVIFDSLFHWFTFITRLVTKFSLLISLCVSTCSSCWAQSLFSVSSRHFFTPAHFLFLRSSNQIVTWILQPYVWRSFIKKPSDCSMIPSWP